MYRNSEEYAELQKVIIDIYIDYDIKGFPIDVFALCKKMGASVVPYTALGDDNLQLLIKKSKFGFFVRGTDGFPPTIYYNDTLDSVGSQRLTIIHELKHYVYDEYTDDEEEDDLANSWARYLLCPIPFLIILGIESPNEIISFCNVSLEAAENAASNIRNRKSKYGNQIFSFEEKLLNHLDKDVYKRFCRIHKDAKGGKDE